MGKILMGVWDCKYCGNEEIPGNLRECPGCGSPRGEGVKFYLPNNAKVLTSKDAEEVNKNPDWMCDHCGCYNSANLELCESCGNPREDCDLNYFEHHEELKKKESQKNENFNFEVLDKVDNVQNDSVSNSYKIEDTNNEVKGFSNIFSKIKNILTPKFLIIFSIIAVIIFGIIALAIPKVEKMNVEQLLWEYCVDIEKYQTVNESDWYLPSDARLQRTTREFHHYEQVFDHYETKTKQVAVQVFDGYKEVVVGYRDMGNGYFEEITRNEPVYRTEYRTETYQESVYKTVPVYKTKYYYEIDKWLYDRTEKSKGTDTNTYWPEYKLTNKERVSDKETAYFVRVVDSDGEYQNISVKYENWLEIEVGSVVTVKEWLWTSKIVFE